MRKQKQGTDIVPIRCTQLPMYDDPQFAWFIKQLSHGDSVNGVVETLPPEQRKFLDALERVIPKKRQQRIDRFTESLTEIQRKTFNLHLTNCQPNSPCPTETVDMSEAMKSVQGVRWLWRGWIPYSMCCEVFGEPGDGKSAFVLGGIINAVTTGCKWPDGQLGPRKPHNVLWCDTEGKTGETVERIKRWGLPPKRILLPFPDIFQPICITNPDHLRRIELLIGSKSIHLVVIDALRTAHGHDENCSRVAQALQPLAQIAERTNTAITVVHHSRKLQIGEDITANASRGSNAIHAMMRSAIGIDKPDPDSPFRRVSVVKENLGSKPKPMGFCITDTGLQFGEAPQRPHRETQQDKAAAFLRDKLSDGKPHHSKPIIDEGEQHGFSGRTLQRVVTGRLGVRPDKQGSKWFWQLKRNQGDK